MTARSAIVRARALRAGRTEAEARLWARLRGGKLGGFKFRRQVPIDRYIADFACLSAKLVVELDGGHHAESLAYDAERTRVLETCGFHVVRFWNHAVMQEPDTVIDAIWAVLNRRF